MSKYTDTTVFEHIEETIDSKTGEVTLTEKKSIVKQAKTPEFIMMFTEGAPFLAGAKLTGAQTSVLFMLLHKFVLPRDNVLLLTSYTRQTISNEMNIAKNTVDSAILKLIDTKIILVKKEMGKVYYLNPKLFGKGNWNDIKKLRYQTSVEYDFENRDIDITNATTFGYGDVDKDNIIVTGVEENISEDKNLIEQKVYIEDKIKEENKGDYSIVTVNPIKENEQENNILEYEKDQQEERRRKIDLDFINAQNRKLELEIKKEELEVRKLEIEERKSIKNEKDKQGTLFGDEL